MHNATMAATLKKLGFTREIYSYNKNVFYKWIGDSTRVTVKVYNRAIRGQDYIIDTVHVGVPKGHEAQHGESMRQSDMRELAQILLTLDNMITEAK